MSETSLELLGMFTYEIRLRTYRQPLVHSPGTIRAAAASGRRAASRARRWSVQAARTKIRSGFVLPSRLRYTTVATCGLKFPKTQMWAVLYARVQQTDAASWRNLLLARAGCCRLACKSRRPMPRALLAEGRFLLNDIESLLKRLGLPDDAALTTLAVRLFTDPIGSDPLGRELGHARALRVSPLIPVPDAC